MTKLKSLKKTAVLFLSEVSMKQYISADNAATTRMDCPANLNLEVCRVFLSSVCHVGQRIAEFY
jgi:hypothetical protein